MNFIKQKIDELSKNVNNKYYREYLKFFFKYSSKARYKTEEVNFLNYYITVPDCLSFIFQFKEIFVKESYKFDSDLASPVIYDCGANAGISVLYFKSLYPSARIKAFEADPEIANLLDSNLKRNFIKDVEVIPKAVWINEGGVEFASDKADGGSIFGDGQKIKVPSIRLKDFLNKEDKINLLKLDIEGAEVEVLVDCKNSFSNVENLFVEYHGWKGFPQKLDEILAILSENKFRYFIGPVTEMEQPLIRKKILNSDLQLNIFAEKI